MSFLVDPPLAEDEIDQVRFEDNGNFRFTLYENRQVVLTVLKWLRRNRRGWHR